MAKKQTYKNWQEVELGEIALVDSGQGTLQGKKYFQGKEVFVRVGYLNNLTEGIFVGEYCEFSTFKPRIIKELPLF